MRKLLETVCAGFLLQGIVSGGLAAERANSVYHTDGKLAAEVGSRKATRSFVAPREVNYHEPAREYVDRRAGGWNFHLERELAERRPEQAQRVVARLHAKLDQTLALLPARSHDLLRKLSLFVMLGPEAAGGGRDNGAEYFRSSDPDFHPLLDLRWRRAIVVYSAENYLRQDEHWAVQMLLHEFAHAWQLEQWPEKEPEIMTAWERAKTSGLYRGVKDVNGTVLERAYALHNQLEYFAELSCAYFWRGEYEPFDREALRRYDPIGLAMIEKMWGVNGPAPPPSPRAGQNE